MSLIQNEGSFYRALPKVAKWWGTGTIEGHGQGGECNNVPEGNLECV